MRRFTHVLGSCLVLAACPKEQVGPVSDAGSTERASEGGTTGGSSTGEPIPTTGGAGSSTGFGESSGSTGAVGSSTGPGERSSSSSGGSSGEATTGSTSSGEATTGPPPWLFECFGCSCDAEVSFCRKVFAGFGGGEALCPIVEADGLDSGCALYPRGCVDAPSCACLLRSNGECFCTEKRPGEFEVTCPLP